nr:hypothetical protein [Tanacetum cinerariifolium]
MCTFGFRDRLCLAKSGVHVLIRLSLVESCARVRVRLQVGLGISSIRLYKEKSNRKDKPTLTIGMIKSKVFQGFVKSLRKLGHDKRATLIVIEEPWNLNLEIVFLKVSPCRGARRFGLKGKLSPRFIGPFEILDRVGEVSYRLALPPQLSHVHNVFHVSLLRGYNYHPYHVVQYPFDKIREDLSFAEEPEAILDRQELVIRKKTIPLVKVLWKNHPEREATWENKEMMRTDYPHFFSQFGTFSFMF